jgi:hypothetical protein
MNIHQLSVRYLPEQDRILLSVNTTDGQELELWLTRRMCLALWPQLNRMTVDHFAVPAQAKSDGFVDLAALDVQTRKALVDFRRQELLQTADFKTPYRANAGQRPLGQLPLLATEITMTPDAGKQVVIDFKEQMEAKGPSRALQLALQPQLVFSLVHMLGQALEHTQWLSPVQVAGLPGLVASGDATSPADKADEGMLPDPARPRYLN